ncbi:MAG TPA: flagellar motor switch protein FliG, partial [Armatimonadetes bacterium]|nr:flagellar motor switch protein FliG [Armatimonadota bacterium]
MSLGESEAAAILKNLGPKEVQAIGTSMSQLQDIKQEQVETAVG